ncbi:MAG TPA: arginine--tRNA ligase [Alphaproteobacteria bacterium]|nr:arginine--tRNA ligase [Alphaproteobacteria bacterium]
MNLFSHFRDEIARVLTMLAEEGRLPDGLDLSKVGAEPPREAEHGDITTNAAMILAKPAGLAPRKLAELIAERLSAHPDVTGVEIAGPGFINLRLSEKFWRARLADLLRAGPDWGRSRIGAGRSVNVEYVSANPTGPLHLGHVRGAVFGDVLSSLLESIGYKVTREYYINDAGAQVEVLARSAHLRYLEALGEEIGPIPEGFYPGEYLREVGRALAERDGARWRGKPEAEWLGPVRDFAVERMMDLIRADLELLGVRQDVFSSERAMVKSGGVEKAITVLEEKDLVYVGVLEPPKGKTPEEWEPRPQTLFRSARFGDDVDRPLKKSDGSWTYFAPDIAYHYDKWRRGSDILIDVWGADHSGYVKRMKAAVSAITDGKAELDVKVCQLVRLFREGQPVKMSKRGGTFITLREVVEEVGKDVVRFMMLTRRNDAPLDFDLAKAIEQSRDNPVFYVQYAHARCHSVLRLAAETFPSLVLAPESLARQRLELLNDPHELHLLKLLAAWPRMVETGAEAHEPHRLAFFLYDVAAAFHGLWNRGKDEAALRFLIADDAALSAARLALVRAVALVVASGLGIFGVTPLEEMR